MFINNYQNDLWMRDDALLRAGAVDAQQADAAGRAAVRPRVELGAAAAGRAGRVPADAARLPEDAGVDSYKDITPRVAATYDLFGNGKTAIKANIGKYLESTITASNYGIANPTSRIAQNVTRNWTDSNRNFVADCDLLNPAAQDLSATRRRRLRRVLQPATSARTSSATRSIRRS